MIHVPAKKMRYRKAKKLYKREVALVNGFRKWMKVDVKAEYWIFTHTEAMQTILENGIEHRGTYRSIGA